MHPWAVAIMHFASDVLVLWGLLNHVLRTFIIGLELIVAQGLYVPGR